MDEKSLKNSTEQKIVCRLCLNTLFLECAIPIFEKKDKSFDLQAVIAKYLHLELNADNTISTSICQDCFDHLEEFHRFYRNVDQKQKSLQQSFDFLEVKCENVVDEDVGKKDEIPVQDCLYPIQSLQLVDEEFRLNNEKDPVQEEVTNLISKFKTEEIEYSTDDDTPLTELYAIKTNKGNTTTHSSTEEEPNAPELKIKVKTKKLKDSEMICKEEPSAQSMVLDDCELRCEMCNIEVGNYYKLRKHFEKRHRNMNAFIMCCGQKYTDRKSIGRHLRRHENGEIREISKPSECAQCDQCSRSFSSETRLKHHRKRMHAVVLPYQCDACEESFLTKLEEDNHRLNCKNRELAQSAPAHNGHVLREQKNQETICKVCCKMFPSYHELRAHIASIHENTKTNYICEQCGKKFKLKASLEKHQLFHQCIVEPPAQCETCGKWLKSESSLRVHRYMHNSSFNKCSLCEHVSTNRRALRRHVERVHFAEHNFHCQYCEKSFKNSTYLEEHTAIHTGANLYECPHCGKESRSRSNMYAHVKRMHPEEWLRKQLARSNDPTAKGVSLNYVRRFSTILDPPPPM